MTIQNAELYLLKDDSEVDNFLSSLLQKADQKRIKDLFNLISKPLSVLLEKHYVDKVFRDSYYKYFSSKHFDASRNCRRISFYSGEIELDDFYSETGHQKLQERFIGFAVIKPISPGCLGRTYLDPKKININLSYIRTTKFTTTILGARFEIESFPFSSQDTETMTCAETTVWSILEYYGTRYSDYKIAYPSEIVDALANGANERVLPSKGLSLVQISSLFKGFGFSPRIYSKGNGAFNDPEFKRIMHYYVESGIPIALGVSANQNGIPVGHAVVCIGHSDKKESSINPEISKGIYFVNSADFYSQYVIMDDNQVPFAVQDYNGITTFQNPEVDGIVVPLYKRIFLEATEADTITRNILFHNKIGVAGALNNLNQLIDAGQIQGINKYSSNNPMVVRLFLTSSRQFKRFRSLNFVHETLDKPFAKVYSQLPMPKFIWVAEISLKDEYMNKKVLGEIILDATASTYSGLNSLISIHYPGFFAWRQPNESLQKLVQMLSQYTLPVAYPLYENNLSQGGV